MRLLNRFFSGDKRSINVKKNIIGSLCTKGISIIVSLLLVPMTLGYVSSELYGVWLTLSSIMIWLNFFDIGFTLGLKNKLAEAIALNDWAKGKALVSTTYFMMFLIFIPVCIILFICIPHINWVHFLNVDNIYSKEITRALYILVSCFCLQMIVNVLIAIIAAFQKVALSSVFPVIGNILSLLTIYIMTKLCPPSLTNLALAISLMPILVLSTASFILFKSTFKAVTPSIKHINKSYIKELWGLGFKFFFIQIQVVILYQSTNILISNIAGPNEVTSYNIAYKYLSVAMMLYTIILSPLWPAFTNAYTQKDFQWMRNIYKKMSYIFVASAIALIIMILVSPFAYNIWIGKEVIVPYSMTILVGVYMIVYSWNSLQVQLINGIGTIKLQTYVTLLGLLIHIPFSLFLGKYTGAIGVILSMLTINIIYATFFTIQLKKILSQKGKGIWIM